MLGVHYTYFSVGIHYNRKYVAIKKLPDVSLKVFTQLIHSGAQVLRGCQLSSPVNLPSQSSKL